MINVLLVSPRLPESDIRYAGDNAYTDTLLRYPPPGVRFRHYEDLMTIGQVRKMKWLYRIGPRLRKWGVLPPDLWAEYLVCDWVPDLLHVEGFSAAVRFSEPSVQVPVVLGTSTGSCSDLRYYLRWDERRIRRSRWLKRQYLHAIDAHDTSLRPERAARVIVWSDFARRLHLDEGYVRADQIQVLYPGLPWRGNHLAKDAADDELTFLFVGRDFERKNGDLAIEAFRQIHEQYPKTHLILVGRPADGRFFAEPGVTHCHFLPRQELLDHVYPKADVLLLPSKAEGFGLVLLEAMSFGMPVIAVNEWAMVEVVRQGVNGLLIPPNSLDGLVRGMLQYLKTPNWREYTGQKGKEVFTSRFSIESHNDHLRKLYDRVLLGQSV